MVRSSPPASGSLPTPRAAVAAIPPYVPGRRPVLTPGVVSYKLSSNENPYPPLPGVLEAVASANAAMNTYPDPSCPELYSALSARLGVDADHLLAGTGSVALIFQLLSAYTGPGDEVVMAWRSFEAYPIAIAAADATDVRVPLAADGRHDLGAMAAAITERTRVVLLCTPNNPTGPAITAAELAAFLVRVPRDVLVVVDEAYVEFVRSDDPVDGVAVALAHPNVIALRTFSKAYGLAGLRVGYAIGQPHLLAPIRSIALPFGVTAAAQIAVVASFAADEELMARVDALVAERARVVAALAELGWEIPDAQGNFVWFALGERTLDAAVEAEAAGIVVRPFDGEGVRVTIGEPAANDRIVEWARSLK